MANENKKILIALTPSESKRVIAKGVKNLEEVQRALKQGTIIIGLGTTNAYVADEILSELSGANKIDKQRYAAGVITDKGTCVVTKEEREKEVIIKNGVVSSEKSIEDVIEELSAEDVFIKGANALDAYGNAGILLAHTAGGTIGSAIGTVMARGVNFIIPVGIEKMIPYSITEAAKRVGKGRFFKSVGMPVGLMPVYGTVITEIEALILLGAEDAFTIGAGGVAGGEGSVVICAEGSAESMEDLMRVITQIKGEAPVKVMSVKCE
uniref:Uncharacterized protein n=1 Tax=Candidatus Methanophagaceae archaeon ANME-1 ERB6 TaxID=2759912 RepID=A0A7G9Z0G4_9EURY|nr:hypothetical protein ONPGGGGH_00047 [Methanosarcinales archaeon ANME-1 ERB6]